MAGSILLYQNVKRFFINLINNRDCSTHSSKNDWINHKSFCKTLLIVEKDPIAQLRVLSMLEDVTGNDISSINALSEKLVQNQLNQCLTVIKRPIDVRETNLVVWEPRCMAW